MIAKDRLFGRDGFWDLMDILGDYFSWFGRLGLFLSADMVYKCCCRYSDDLDNSFVLEIIPLMRGIELSIHPILFVLFTICQEDITPFNP